MGLVVLVTGDRKWEGDDPKSPLYLQSRTMMMELLQSLPWDAVIREGCAMGADHAAETIAANLGLKVKHHPADWEKLGKKAGPIRNREMFWAKDEGWIKPNLVAAFHNDIGRSVGTKDMISVAKQFGTEVKLFAVPKEPEEGE